MNDQINVNDLTIESKKELTLEEIFSLINDSICNRENWTIEDLADGKEIDVFPEWVKYIDIIANAYKKVGWELFIFEINRKQRQYFSFQRPKSWR